MSEAGIANGSVIHLVLNERPLEGRSLYVRSNLGQSYRLDVLADFTIEDVKDELATFQGMPPSEEMRLMFAGPFDHIPQQPAVQGRALHREGMREKGRVVRN